MTGRWTVRITSLLKNLLGIKQLLVGAVGVVAGALVLDVRPTWRRPRCSGCGRKRPGYDTLPARQWRHLDFGGVEVFLRYAPRRVNCRRCGVVVERVPWSEEADSRFTRDFENQVAYLAQRCDKTSITEMFRIAWETVGRIIERVVRRKRPENPLADLEQIGVDELSYRKHHHYVTLVTDQQEGRIVWGKEGKSAETLLAFFEALGEEGRKRIKVVTMDMSQGYIKAVREAVPQAQIVFDRFHVQQLVSNALDRCRREEWQRSRATGDRERAQSLKHTRWALLKNPWNLTPKEEARLSSLQQSNTGLYRAYLLKESFADILDRRQPNVVREKLRSWLAWASRSRLAPFVQVARTIREHLDDIVAYIRWRLTNGVVEGLANKARLLTRRAYGFHSATAVLAMIMLCCTGLTLQPVIKLLSSLPTRT
jgi:transposase